MYSGDQTPTTFYHGQTAGVPQAGPMILDELEYMVDSLLHAVNEGFVVVTHNGLGFDFDVLQEESRMPDECKTLAMGSVDTMFNFVCLRGFRIGLDTIAHGLGLHGKTEGMHGDLAPVMWAGTLEDRLKVLEYVGQDARTTLEVAEAGERTGFVPWTSKSGKSNYLVLPTHRWLTVAECLRAPLPDTAWMAEPPTRESFLTWMK